MPSLPTVVVTDAQATRILAAYKAKHGTTTQAETVEAYKRDLIIHVRQVVMEYESALITQSQHNERVTLLAQVDSELPQPAPPVEPPVAPPVEPTP